MTEHVQLEIVAAVVLIAMNGISAWRAEMANWIAVKAQKIATESRGEQSVAIEQVHQAVNGGWVAQQKVIRDLEDKISRLEAIIAQNAESPEKRLEEIRGQIP